MLEKFISQDSQAGIGKELNKKLNNFAFEHGSTVAKTATLIRIPGGFLVSHLIKNDRYVLAQIAHAGFSLTDAVDGWFARKSKEGPSQLWGEIDSWADKIFTGTVEQAEVKKGLLERKHQVRTVRDVIFSGVVRPYYKSKGVENVGAVRSGKIAMDAVCIADNLALARPLRNRPKFNNVIQNVATGLKLYAAWDTPRQWRRRQNVKDTEKVILAEAQELPVYPQLK